MHSELDDRHPSGGLTDSPKPAVLTTVDTEHLHVVAHTSIQAHVHKSRGCTRGETFGSNASPHCRLLLLQAQLPANSICKSISFQHMQLPSLQSNSNTSPCATSQLPQLNNSLECMPNEPVSHQQPGRALMNSRSDQAKAHIL